MSSFDSLIRGFNSAAEHAPVAAAVAVTRVAYAIEADAKAHAPVDTGALRNSISTDVHAGAVVDAEIGPTVDYGEYVELGTSKMAPEPYLGPAFDAHEHEVEPALLAIADIL